METLNINFLRVLSEFGTVRSRTQALQAETDKLAATLVRLQEEGQSLGGDSAKYKADERRALEQTMADLRAEIAAAEAKPPKFFGKSEHQARLENLRTRIDMSQQTLERVAKEGVEWVRSLPELVATTERELAEKKAALEAEEARFAHLQGGMKMLRGDGYANGMRPAMIELVMIGKEDDRLAYIEATEGLEKGLKLLQELEGAELAAKKSELVYLYIQNMLFKKWFRPTIPEPTERFVKLAEELEELHTDDWMLELAIAFGRFVDVGATFTGGRRKGFQEELLLALLGDKLKAVEDRLIRVLRDADQDSWKVMAKEHLGRIDGLRQNA